MINFTGLYAITGGNIFANLTQAVAQTIAGGASLIQYRHKNISPEQQLWEAQDLQNLCSGLGTPLIINDNVQLAQSVSAAGVHLGVNDTSLKTARAILGPNVIIGVSCYNQLQLAINAENNGADYVAFGSFFASQTKPNVVTANLDLLTIASKTLTIPIVAIGGITSQNCQPLITAGADMLAIIDGVFANDLIKDTSQQICQQFSLCS